MPTEKREIDLNAILDFIRSSIFALEGTFGNCDIVVCMPRYIITCLELHNRTFTSVVFYSPGVNKVFDKPIQPNYTNSIVVFVDHLYITNDAKHTLEL